MTEGALVAGDDDKEVSVRVIEIVDGGKRFKIERANGKQDSVDRADVYAAETESLAAEPQVPHPAPESWLQRNKAWCVPTSLVGATTAAAAIYGFVFGVPTVVKEAVPASLASMKKAMTSALNVTAPAVPKTDAAVVFGKSDSIR